MAWTTQCYTPHSRHTPPPPSGSSVVVNFDLLSHILEPPLSRMDQPPSTHYSFSRSSLSCLHQNPIYSPISRFCHLTDGALLTSAYRPSIHDGFSVLAASFSLPLLHDRYVYLYGRFLGELALVPLLLPQYSSAPSGEVSSRPQFHVHILGDSGTPGPSVLTIKIQTSSGKKVLSPPESYREIFIFVSFLTASVPKPLRIF